MENKNLANVLQTKEKSVVNFVKKYFWSGLLILLPVWVTLWVLLILFKWISSLSMPILAPIFKFFINDSYLVNLLATVSSFFLTIIIICFFGYLTTKLIGRKLFGWLEHLLLKLPLIGSIYSSIKKLLSFFTTKDKQMNFQKVVFVPFPTKDSYCVAFSTGEKIINGQKYITTFMPTTPNPTTGFLMLIKEEDVIESEYNVEDAIQYIMSAGIINPQVKEKGSLPKLEK